jgi:hypothetical protein
VQVLGYGTQDQVQHRHQELGLSWQQSNGVEAIEVRLMRGNSKEGKRTLRQEKGKLRWLYQPKVYPSTGFRWVHPFKTGCSPLSYSGNPGANGVSYRGVQTGYRLRPSGATAIALSGSSRSMVCQRPRYPSHDSVH